MSISPTMDGSRKPILHRMFSSWLKPGVAIRKLLHGPSGSSTSTELDLSGRRRALQSTIATMNIASSVAGTIPGFGPQLKGALEAVWKALVLIEQRYQNADDVARLAARVNTLMEDFAKIQGLLFLEKQLNSILSDQGLRSETVAQMLAGCDREINAYLHNYTAATVASIRASQLRMEQLTTECLVVVDPFGCKQKVPCAYMGNVKLVAEIILNQYSVNPAMHHALNGYVSAGKYELTMDDGQQIQSLQATLPTYRGATVIMNVVMEAVVGNGYAVYCPICPNMLSVSQDERAICHTCERRVTSVGTADHSTSRPYTRHALVDLFRHITLNPIDRNHVPTFSSRSNFNFNTVNVASNPRSNDDTNFHSTKFVQVNNMVSVARIGVLGELALPELPCTTFSLNVSARYESATFQQVNNVMDRTRVGELDDHHLRQATAHTSSINHDTDSSGLTTITQINNVFNGAKVAEIAHGHSSVAAPIDGHTFELNVEFEPGHGSIECVQINNVLIVTGVNPEIAYDRLPVPVHQFHTNFFVNPCDELRTMDRVLNCARVEELDDNH